MKQEFHTERKFHFNLRKPKGERATPIYIVVFIGGKQYKLSTNVKVNPLHWDSTRQLAIISNTNSRLDNKNNRIVNERLEQVKGYYLEFIDYLCSREETPSNVGEVLKSYIYKDMAKKKTIIIDVIKTIKEAFSYYYRNIRQVKESSRNESEKLLNIFVDYIKEKKLNDSVEVFKQSGLNAYRDYNVTLKEKGEIGIERINKRCELIARLINKVIVVEDSYSQFGFTPVTYVKMEDKRQQDEIGRVPLFDDEIQAIKDCQSLNDKEKEYRTIFLLQCASGLRESDLIPIVREEYKIKDNIITVQTIKKGTYAQIYVTDEVREYLQETKEIKLINLDKFSNSQYNKHIKNICRKAGLNRVIDWKDAKEKSQSNQLWEIVSSHYARHTFITNKVKEGVPYEKLILMTGHSDDKMIKEVYSHLTKEDKAEKVREYYNTTGAKEKEIESSMTMEEVLSMMKPDKDISIYEFDSDLINKEIQSEIADNKEFIDKYQLNKSDIEFIYNAYLPTIEVGYHSLKIIKQLKRLMERGLIICTYKGNQCPDQLKDIKINPIFE